MTGKEFYEFFRDQRAKASKLARETVKVAREQRIDIPSLVSCICQEYAASEASIAESFAYDGGYDKGYSDGRFEEGHGW